jgi:predicted AAA+ superfamily ATPase
MICLSKESESVHRYTARFLLYRNFDQDEILVGLAGVFKKLSGGNYLKEELIEEVYGQIHQLLDFAALYGFGNNLWHNYLAYLLASSENPFSLACDRDAPELGSIGKFAKNDLVLFKKLFDYDFSEIESELHVNCFSMIGNFQAIEAKQNQFDSSIREKICELSENIAKAKDEDGIFRIVAEYYRKHGVGKFGFYNVFRINSSSSGAELEPITNSIEVHLDDLIGYDTQKKMLVDNTEAFIQGKRANNLLLYGDSGTGKSTCIRAIQNMYKNDGLIVIEIYKHQLKYLSTIISMIKHRNYRFILFMDDLSFDDFETEFKYLKAVIEGGLEITPDNVLVYATSNRRHLIKETWTDRKDSANEDEIHLSDTAEEKISLFNRFGVTIRFNKPSPQEFLEIVKELAKRYPEIQMPVEELVEKANKWGIWHGNISGRRAQQFINYLIGQS